MRVTGDALYGPAGEYDRDAVSAGVGRTRERTHGGAAVQIGAVGKTADRTEQKANQTHGVDASV
jgi:hypothetical protein